MRVFVFWPQAFCKTALSRFSYEFIGFLRPELFFNESVCFFGFRHFVRRCCAVFSHEFIGFLRPEVVFSMRMFVFLASGIL